MIKIVASIIVIIFFTAYLASQLTAAGKALNSIVNFDYSLGLILSAAFVLGYSIFGGYNSAVLTDLFQGLLMLSVLLIFPLYMIIFELGGFGISLIHYIPLTQFYFLLLEEQRVRLHSVLLLGW